jgi:hypothetical protein
LWIGFGELGFGASTIVDKVFGLKTPRVKAFRVKGFQG